MTNLTWKHEMGLAWRKRLSQVVTAVALLLTAVSAGAECAFRDDPSLAVILLGVTAILFVLSFVALRASYNLNKWI